MTTMVTIDGETERLAKRLVEVTGKPLESVMRDAIEAEARRAGLAKSPRPARADLLARMQEITEGFASLPVLDQRPADEIIGYDELGVPR